MLFVFIVGGKKKKRFRCVREIIFFIFCVKENDLFKYYYYISLWEILSLLGEVLEIRIN